VAPKQHIKDALFVGQHLSSIQKRDLRLPTLRSETLLHAVAQGCIGVLVSDQLEAIELPRLAILD
jgi:hypothetical protein